MSKIKNGGLDQYGAEPCEQQQFGTAGVEGVKIVGATFSNSIRPYPPRHQEWSAQLSDAGLQEVFRAIAVTRLTYASTAYSAGPSVE